MTASHWSRMASHWRLVGPPLRPATADIAAFRQVVAPWISGLGRAPRVLILGVTPELHAMRWPAGTPLLALDNSLPMIEAVWPGPPGSAVQGSWTAMPLAAGSCDIALCDGGFGTLPFPQGQVDLLRELHRVLVPGGVFGVRLFAPVGRTGTVEEILAALDAGEIASLDALKLRLWGALHGRHGAGVRPREVVATILAAAGDFERLAARQGWSREHVRTLELHRTSTAVYHLTDPEEVARMATHDVGSFETVAIVEPDHAMGNCCPVLGLRRGAMDTG